MVEIAILGKGAGAAAGLHDHGRFGLLSRGHDGLNLLHIVDIECAYAVAAFGGFVEELPRGDKRHEISPLDSLRNRLRKRQKQAKSGAAAGDFSPIYGSTGNGGGQSQECGISGERSDASTRGEPGGDSQSGEIAANAIQMILFLSRLGQLSPQRS